MRPSWVSLECEQVGQARIEVGVASGQACDPDRFPLFATAPAKASSIADRLRFELECCLVDDQAGADRHDLSTAWRLLAAQRVAAGNQVHDRVCQAPSGASSIEP